MAALRGWAGRTGQPSTVWGFGDADSWVPGFFTGEGYATLYDVNLQPKPAFFDLQQDLELAAFGAPRRLSGG